MATGAGGIGPGGHIPFSAEWLRQQATQAKKAQSNKGTSETGDASESTTLSDAAQKLAITKDEKMLQTMKAELAKLNPDSESFMEEATGKLIDSVIDQEYGESFKKKPGYENLQDKLTSTILSNEASREAIADFFELLLMAEELQDEDEPEGEDEPEEQEDSEESPEDSQEENED